MPFEIEPRPALAAEVEAVRARIDMLETDIAILQAESDQSADAIQTHEMMLAEVRKRLDALEQPVVVPPPPPARLVGPVYYLAASQYDHARANGITVAHDWVPNAISRFDALAARGMRCDIELAAHNGANGGADTPSEVRDWLTRALAHPKAAAVVRRVLLADEVDMRAPTGAFTPALARTLYAEAKRVAPQWPVAILVVAHGSFWNNGWTQPWLGNDLCDVIQIDHYVHDYPARPLAAICQQIEDAVRRVRQYVGAAKPINFIAQAFDPPWGTPALTMPTPEALRDMGLAALRGGANDVGMWVEGWYDTPLWASIGVAARAWA